MFKSLKKANSFFIVSVTMASFSFVCTSWAGITHSLQHTATTLQPGTYEARGQADAIMNRGGGLNVSGHFRTGLVEDMWDIEGFIGTGKTDFKTGVLTQFNLLPDLPGQIGVGFLGGYTLISDDYKGTSRDTINVLSIAALASKKLAVTFGDITPYGGLQLEALFKAEDNDLPVTGIIGAQWDIAELKPWVFFSELDFDLHDSVFLIGLGGAYRF